MTGEGGRPGPPDPAGGLPPPAQRVRDGAELLDRLAPGWWRHVPIDDLYMAKPETDVLGWLAAAGIMVSGAETDSEDVAHGMDVPDDEADEDSAYDELGRRWCWEMGVRVGLDHCAPLRDGLAAASDALAAIAAMATELRAVRHTTPVPASEEDE